MKQILPKTLIGIFLLCRIQWSSSLPRRTWTYPKKNKWKASWFPSKNATTTPRPVNPNETMVFDFKILRHTDDWHEDSEGYSSADFMLVGEARHEHCVFYTELEPLDEKSVAIARTQYHFLDKPLNMSGFHFFRMKARSAITNPKIVWKIFLRHNGDMYDKPCYEATMKVPVDPDYKIVEIPLAKFVPMFENEPAPKAPPLNKENITMFGIQGQSMHDMKAAIHVLWIKASKHKIPKKVVIITKPTTTTKFDYKSFLSIPENETEKVKTKKKGSKRRY